MKPMSPVLPKQPMFIETIIAKDQPEYQPLPAVITTDGTVISRWSLTWRERLRVLWTGSLWFQQLTFGYPLQPQLPQVKEPTLIVSE